MGQATVKQRTFNVFRWKLVASSSMLKTSVEVESVEIRGGETERWIRWRCIQSGDPEVWGMLGVSKEKRVYLHGGGEASDSFISERPMLDGSWAMEQAIGKALQADMLTRLGASQIVDRTALQSGTEKMLLKEKR